MPNIKNKPVENLIINSGFDFNQRYEATPITNAVLSNYYWDRWFLWNSQTQDYAATAASSTYFSKAVSTKCALIGRTDTATNTGDIRIGYALEEFDVYPLRGKTLTWSFRHKDAGGFSASFVNAQVQYSTTANQNIASIGSTVVATTFTTSSTESVFSITFAVPTDAKSLGIRLIWTPSGIATTDHIAITDVMLSEGTAADYKRKGNTIGEELALCQRYYEKSYDIGVKPGLTGAAPHYFSGSSDGSPYIYGTLSFKVAKRGTPTMSGISAGGSSGVWDYVRSATSGTNTFLTAYAGYTAAVIRIDVGLAWVPVRMYGHWTAEAEL